MSRPSAVVISPEAPYPMHGGGAIRTASLLHYLSPRYDLDLILFRQAAIPTPRFRYRLVWFAEFRRSLCPFIPGILSLGCCAMVAVGLGAPPLHRFSRSDREIAGILQGRTYDVGLIEHFWCAPYFEQLSKVCKRTVLDLHNIESSCMLLCAIGGHGRSSSAHRRFEVPMCGKNGDGCPRTSRFLVTSEDDAASRQLADSRCVRSPFIGMRSRWYVFLRPTEEQVIGFSGNFEYHPEH